jgi:hypothetical protein
MGFINFVDIILDSAVRVDKEAQSLINQNLVLLCRLELPNLG